MKVFYHPYELKALVPGASSSMRVRRGALLRVQWPSGRVGYSDLHPWPEFGDEPLDEQLGCLRNLKLRPLSKRAIDLAERDALARSERKPLWVTGVQVPNNDLVMDAGRVQVGHFHEIVAVGSTTVKIKCGRDLETEAELVNRIAGRGDLFIRLDFNALPTPSEFQRFMSLISRESDHRIEYVEDPFPYDHEAWREVGTRWRVAIDFELDRSPWSKGERPMADVLILKPARMDVEASVKRALGWDMDITVTSMMDHAVGVMHAYTIAQELKKKHERRLRTAGCLTLGAYVPNEFTEAVPVHGPFLGQPVGTGIGFDELLAAIPWKSISDL